MKNHTEFHFKFIYHLSSTNNFWLLTGNNHPTIILEGEYDVCFIDSKSIKLQKYIAYQKLQLYFLDFLLSFVFTSVTSLF